MASKNRGSNRMGNGSYGGGFGGGNDPTSWQQFGGNGYQGGGGDGGFAGDSMYGFGDWGANGGGGGGNRGSGFNRGGRGGGKGIKRNYDGNPNYGGNQGAYGFNQGGFGGNYGNNQGNYGGNPGKWPRGSGGGRGYDYNTNPEWYDEGNYDGAGGYGWDDYSGYNAMSRGGRGGYQGRNPWWNQDLSRGKGSHNKVWQRGMPRWQGEKEKATVKKPKEGEVVKTKGKKKVWNPQRVIKFKELMTLKNKYRSVRQNKHLNPEQQIALVFLKRVTYDMCEPDLMVHCICFSKLASRHRNALKIFAHEAKIRMDRKYDPSVDGNLEKRKQYLKELKDDTLDGFKKVYKQRAVSEDMKAKEAIIEKYLAIVSGENFTPDDVPTEKDYLMNKDHSRREEDFILDFKNDFVFNCYEMFKFKPDELKTPTKDIAKRVQFHLNNSLISFLLVESVRAKELIKTLPEPLSKYVFLQSEVHQSKNQQCLDDAVALCKENGETVVTPISRYMTPGTDYATEVFRDFADCILLFDKFATYLKFRLLKYTPQILLPATVKAALYEELVDKIYREAFNILVNNERFETKQIVDMERDEGKEEAKVTPTPVPVENVKTD